MFFSNSEENPKKAESRSHKQVADIKINGKWIKSYCEMEDGVYTQYSTRAAITWRSMKYRCKSESFIEKFPTYVNCINEFSDFQMFADWCQDEQGYMNKQDCGKFWSLDKDILLPLNKVYGPETCCFIPAEINCLIISSNSMRGSLPIGVSWHSRDKVLSAQCQDGTGKIKYLGKVNTPDEGHRLWQKFKISVLLEKAEKYSSYTKINKGLLSHAELIQYDYDSQIETIR